MLHIIEPNLKFASALTYKNKPTIIVIHHALHDKCTIEDVHKWHLNNGWAGCGYHYFVSRAGKVYRGRPENAVGAHEPAVNWRSIGICLEGCYQDYTVNGRVMTQKEVPIAQAKALIELTKDIKSRLSIDVSNIKKHNHYNPKLCPGNYFPWEKFIAEFKPKEQPKPEVPVVEEPKKKENLLMDYDIYKVYINNIHTYSIVSLQSAIDAAVKDYPKEAIRIQNLRTGEFVYSLNSKEEDITKFTLEERVSILEKDMSFIKLLIK